MLDCYFTEVLDHQPGYGPTEWCFIVKTKDEWESGSDNFVHLAFKFPDGTECITKPLYDPAINNFCGPPACPEGLQYRYCHDLPRTTGVWHSGCENGVCAKFPGYCTRVEVGGDGSPRSYTT